MVRGKLVTGAVAAYIAGLVAFAPATLVDAALDRTTGGRLRLTAPGGSLWAGRGQLELRAPDTRLAVGTPVEWRLKPASLLDSAIGFDVRARDAAQPFAVTLSWRRVELAGARMSLPAASLGLALPTLAPLELTGSVSLDVASAVWANGELNGGAAVRWTSAGSALSKISPLGSYELRLECARSIARLALSTIDGTLHLSGAGAWTLGQRPQLRASARVPPSHRPQLSPLLALVGVEREPGRFELELK